MSNWPQYFTIILLFLTATCKVDSQELNSLSCRVVAEATKKPVTYAHVYNESRRFGTISDSKGQFRLKALPGDTLIFIALGYLGKYYVVTQNDFNTTFSIALRSRSYNIEEVSIHFPRNYKTFKQEILDLDLKKDKPMAELPQHNPYKTPYLLDTSIVLSAEFMIAHPVSGLYYRFSKVEKSKRKVWQLQQQDMKQSRVDEKYNRAIVAEITGLSGDDLTVFMGFCNFHFNYLFESTPYEIITNVELKYQEYLKCCYDR